MTGQEAASSLSVRAEYLCVRVLSHWRCVYQRYRRHTYAYRAVIGRYRSSPCVNAPVRVDCHFVRALTSEISASPGYMS